MAEAVFVRHGDTLTKILKEKRMIQDYEIHAWQNRMVKLNPHISNLNRIFPGDSILIPDTLHETIPRPRIWQNAFSQIPKALTRPWHGATLIYFVHPGDTIDKVAKQLNGRVARFSKIGRWGTWYIPAILDLINVAAAPPETKVKTLFEEGFGVLGGAFGSMLGTAAGLGIVTILCWGPVGLFVTVLICASIVGVVGMEFGKWFGGRIYDIENRLSGHIYHTMDELVGALND